MTFIENPLGMLQFQRGPVIERELHRRGENVLAQARLNTTGVEVQGVAALGIPGPNNPEGRGPRIRTGRLHGSLRLIDGADFTSLYVDVGTDVFYGAILESGLASGRTYPFVSVALSAAAD
jgi:hypothetical protein